MRTVEVCGRCGLSRTEIEATGVLCREIGPDGYPGPPMEHEPYVVVEAAWSPESSDPSDEPNSDDDECLALADESHYPEHRP